MKQVQKTPDIVSKLQAVLGDDADTSGLSVFECIAANDRPFTGFKGTINENATLSYLTLQQAANLLQAGDSVPMLWDHNKGSVPVGRAFWGELVAAADGSAELRTLFYIDATEPTLVAKLDAASIDEVSVSVATTQMLCSECGFDYAGPDASRQNFYDMTCADGHVIGTDGVHLQRNGLDKFIELSLVTRGAANGAKIVRKVDQKLAGAQITRLAARGFDPDALVLRASATPIQSKKDEPMDLKELNAQLVTAMVDAQTASGEVTRLKASLTSTETALTAAQADVTRLTAELEAAKAAKPEVAKLEAATAFLKDVYTRTLTAANKAPKAEDVPTDPEALVAGITEHQANLKSIIIPGGLSASADADTDPTTKTAGNYRAFTGK